MKFITYSLGIAALVFSACSSPQNQGEQFTITVPGDAGMQVQISKIEGNTMSMDSTLSHTDGAYRFASTTEQPAFYNVNINGKPHMLILSNGESVEIISDPASPYYELKGSSEHSEKMAELSRDMSLFMDKIDSLQSHYSSLVQSVGQEEREQLIADFDAAAGEMIDANTERLRSFIENNLSSPAVVPALYQQVSGLKFLDPDKDLDLFEKVLSSMQENYPEAAFTKQLAQEIASQKSHAIGAKVPEFELPNPAGEMVNIRSFEGKVVLIDFWASWCGPCRRESPNLVRAYKRFSDKGFDIVSVSLDGTQRQREPRKSWLAAIEKDGLSAWTHISDLKGWNTSVRPLFQFDGIPHTVLIDAEGKIIAKNLRGRALEEKLEELFPA